jgi:clan AA aspartic protease
MSKTLRVKVKLINAVDEALARRGRLNEEDVRFYEADALIDTRAISSVLPPFVVEQLGLMATGKRAVEYADGRTEAVDVTEPLTVDIFGRRTSEEAFVLGDEVLIGRTVLEKTDLLVDCANRRVIPNLAHPDQPVSKIK